MSLCVIPARGGSKRIPRKNLRSFGGKPILAYSIESALASECFDRVVVSTDDDEIAEAAKRWGAAVPFRRPEELSGDHVGTNAVVGHALRWFSDHGEDFTEAACIYATAPFLLAEDIRKARDLLRSNPDASFVVTVASFPFPIQRAIRMSDAGRSVMFFPEHRLTRSQDLPEAYHDAGQLYWGRTGAFLGGEPLFDERTIPLVLPRTRVQDIDTPEDWRTAEAMFRALQLESD